MDNIHLASCENFRVFIDSYQNILITDIKYQKIKSLPNPSISIAKFSNCRNLLFLGNENGSIYIWDTKDWNLLYKFKCITNIKNNTREITLNSIIRDQPEKLLDFFISNDSTCIALKINKEIHLWKNFEFYTKFRFDNSKNFSGVFSLDNLFFGYYDCDGFKIFDLENLRINRFGNNVETRGIFYLTPEYKDIYASKKGFLACKKLDHHFHIQRYNGRNLQFLGKKEEGMVWLFPTFIHDNLIIFWNVNQAEVYSIEPFKLIKIIPSSCEIFNNTCLIDIRNNIKLNLLTYHKDGTYDLIPELKSQYSLEKLYDLVLNLNSETLLSSDVLCEIRNFINEECIYSYV